MFEGLRIHDDCGSAARLGGAARCSGGEKGALKSVRTAIEGRSKR